MAAPKQTQIQRPAGTKKAVPLDLRSPGGRQLPY